MSTRKAARLAVPGATLVFGNGVIAAAIYGRMNHIHDVPRAWLAAVVGEAAGIAVATLLRRWLFPRLWGAPRNLGVLVGGVGGLVIAAASLVGAFGYIFGVTAATIYWGTDPRYAGHRASG